MNSNVTRSRRRCQHQHGRLRQVGIVFNRSEVLGATEAALGVESAQRCATHGAVGKAHGIRLRCDGRQPGTAQIHHERKRARRCAGWQLRRKRKRRRQQRRGSTRQGLGLGWSRRRG